MDDRQVRAPGACDLVLEHFYFLKGVGAAVVYALAVVELLLLIAFLFGVAKRITYGLVFVLHALSTFSSYSQYIHVSRK